jgi:hypothetical protein
VQEPERKVSIMKRQAMSGIVRLPASLTARRMSSLPFRVRGRTQILPHRMIRPAVGDHGKDGNQTASSVENDSDWIKIQDYVAKLNPKILNEAQSVSCLARYLILAPFSRQRLATRIICIQSDIMC